MAQKLRIGTRGSKLALIQTDMVANCLRALQPGLKVEIVEIKTSGDWKPADGETRLSEAQGGKGLFAREIEQALIDNRIDCGIHSMKDMPTFLPAGLELRHMLPRADVRDALLTNGYKNISDLPHGAVVGTSSLRRQAFILALRPDLKIVPLRGNVPTRIEKLRAGQVDATLLALAGLKRLDLEQEISSIIEPGTMLPASGQGAIGIERRKNDTAFADLFDKIHCKTTGFCVGAERAALAVLDGSCHTPIGAHAVMKGDELRIDLAVAWADGREIFRDSTSGKVITQSDADAIGTQLAQKLKSRLPAGILS